MRFWAKKYLNYNIHDLIGIKCNLPVAPPFFLRKSVEHVDMEVYRSRKLEAPLSSLTNLGLRLFYDEGILVHKCHFFLDAHLEIKEANARIKVKFNRLYELVRNPLGYFFAFLQMKFLDRNFAFIHAAGIAKNDKCYLFPAFSDTGKTTTTLSFLRDGYEYLGDDKVITNGREILSYPSPLRKTKLRPFDKIPFLKKLAIRKSVEPPTPTTIQKVPPEKLFFLRIGSKNEAKEANKEDVSEKISIMAEATSPLFPYPMGVMLGYYFIKEIEFKRYIKKRKQIITQLVDRCETFIVTARKSSEFYGLVKEKIK